MANAQAQPTDRYVVSVATAPLTYLAMFLPGGYAQPTAPSVFVGFPALLLVLSLPFHTRVPPLERAAWLLMIAFVAASFVIRPTAEAWHGFTLPHGAPFRATFVLSGLMVMAAWTCWAERPSRRTLTAGAAAFALLVVACLGRQPVNSLARDLALIGGPATAALLIARRAHQRHRIIRRGVPVLLAATVLLTTAGAVYAILVFQAPARRGDPFTSTMSALAVNSHKTIQRNDRWPSARTDPGSGVLITDNDPILLGGQGGAYYSSYVTERTAGALRPLGLGMAMGGRHLWAASDPVLQSLLSVGTRLRRTGASTVDTVHSPAFPLVTIRSSSWLDPNGAPAGTVWASQQDALGAHVYTVPGLRALPVRGTPPQRTAAGFSVAPYPRGASWPTLSAVCPAGSEALLYAPHYNGGIVALGISHNSPGQAGRIDMPVTPLGTVPSSGRIDVAFGTHRGDQSVPVHALGCLDRGLLTDAVKTRRAATSVVVSGHGLKAALPHGSAGTAVIATTAVPGWTCSVDDGPRFSPDATNGLLSVPLGGSADALECGYSPPGLRAGLGAAAVGALVVLLVVLRGLRAGSPTGSRRL
ncbi:YfhO family protein [Streptomyces sp. NBC_00096]